MIKGIVVVFTICLLFMACKEGKTKQTAAAEKKADSVARAQRFFPVTDFIKGQLLAIRQKGVNPVKVVTINKRTDSSWLKIEELDVATNEFVQPLIDSTSLINLFTETRFQDQTLNTFTFTYAPTGKLPDTMELLNWDVYINPDEGSVQKVYMVKRKKENGQDKKIQLTWQADKWCKTVVIATDAKGKASVEREELISWYF